MTTRTRLVIPLVLVLTALVGGCNRASRPRHATFRAADPMVIALPDAAQQVLAGASVPTYVFTGDLAAATIAVSERHWVEVQSEDPALELGFSLFATDAFVDAPADMPLDTAAGETAQSEAAIFMQSEPGSAQLTWTHRNAAYLLSVECPTEDDAHCADPAYIVSLADSLAPAHEETAR